MDSKRHFHYHLPSEQIAQVPAGRRQESRLLWLAGDSLGDRRFGELAELLPPAAVVVVNDTRVIKARLRGRKPTGGAVELLCLEPAIDLGPASSRPAPALDLVRGGERWWCLARGGRLSPGSRIELEGGPEVVVASSRADDGSLAIDFPEPVLPLLTRLGEVPLPPYINRAGGPVTGDEERYQTVYAEIPGAVAAPTAGLHFTTDLLTAISARGCTITPITLHVGWGTFAPIRDDIDTHVMHSERYEIPPATAELVASGRPVVAVGTTVVRTLESAAIGRHQVRSGPGATELFIRPGFRFQVVDHLITNFHLPESTLLMMVCAFAGYQRVMTAYRHAVAEGYRFYSYGDAMLLSHDPENSR